MFAGPTSRGRAVVGMHWVLPLLLVPGCTALNVPRNAPHYADEGWVYPDPTRIRTPEKEVTGFDAWVNDGKEEWAGLKTLLRGFSK